MFLHASKYSAHRPHVLTLRTRRSQVTTCCQDSVPAACFARLLPGAVIAPPCAAISMEGLLYKAQNSIQELLQVRLQAAN
jgi:hypothetical protein